MCIGFGDVFVFLGDFYRVCAIRNRILASKHRYILVFDFCGWF